MFVVYNIEKKVKQVQPLGVHTCKNCGYTGEMALIKEKTTAKLFYLLPIISATNKKAVYCQRCGAPDPLKSAQFKALKEGKPYETVI